MLRISIMEKFIDINSKAYVQRQLADWRNAIVRFDKPVRVMGLSRETLSAIMEAINDWFDPFSKIEDIERGKVGLFLGAEVHTNDCYPFGVVEMSTGALHFQVLEGL